jgi:hypothetical protein
VAGGTIASAPLTSILMASALGLLIGWAWRGSVEADRREDLLRYLPRSARDRLGF